MTTLKNGMQEIELKISILKWDICKIQNDKTSIKLHVNLSDGDL